MRKLETTIDIPEETLQKFCDFLCHNMGMYYPEGKRKEAIPKIEKIIKLFGFENPDRCLDFLTQTPLAKKHIMTLAKELTVGETYFFRNPASFHALQNQIFPSLIQAKTKNNDQTLRIWSAGCCTGEEIYSVAMILHQLIPYPKEWKLQLLGTDINEEFLEKARSGRYKEWSFRGTPNHIKKRYFTYHPHQHTYTLNPEICSMVSFDYLNLISDDYPSSQNPTHYMDLILCNHVLIYFSKPHIEQVVQRLANSLIDSGWLGVSDIEVPFIECSTLMPEKKDEALFFRKGKKIGHTKNTAIPKHHCDQLPNPYFVKPSSTLTCASDQKKKQAIQEKDHPLTTKPTVQKKSSTWLELYHAKKYAEVITGLETWLQQKEQKKESLQPFIPEVILLTKAYANEGNLLKALNWSEKSLSLDKVNPLIHYLHAVILQELDQYHEAIAALNKAAFLDPEFVIVHFTLAVLYQQQKNTKEVGRCLKNALHLLSKYHPEEILPGTDDMTAERLKKISENIRCNDS